MNPLPLRGILARQRQTQTKPYGEQPMEPDREQQNEEITTIPTDWTQNSLGWSPSQSVEEFTQTYPNSRCSFQEEMMDKAAGVMHGAYTIEGVKFEFTHVPFRLDRYADQMEEGETCDISHLTKDRSCKAFRNMLRVVFHLFVLPLLSETHDSYKSSSTEEGFLGTDMWFFWAVHVWSNILNGEKRVTFLKTVRAYLQASCHSNEWRFDEVRATFAMYIMRSSLRQVSLFHHDVETEKLDWQDRAVFLGFVALVVRYYFTLELYTAAPGDRKDEVETYLSFLSEDEVNKLVKSALWKDVRSFVLEFFTEIFETTKAVPKYGPLLTLPTEDTSKYPQQEQGRNKHYTVNNMHALLNHNKNMMDMPYNLHHMSQLVVGFNGEKPFKA